MAGMDQILSIVRQRERAQQLIDKDRSRWEDDPGKPATYLSHLQRLNVPEKKQEKLASNANLAKIEAAIPSGDPRKGLGMEALNLSRQALSESPSNVHPKDVLDTIYKGLLSQKEEETNRYIQKEESSLFGGRKDISKPENYEEWKKNFLAGSRTTLAEDMTNPLESAAIGGGIALAGAGIKRLMAGEVKTPLMEILPSGERVASKVAILEGRGLTGLGRAASKLPFGETLAKWALKEGGATIGTKMLGRLLMGAPPAGPVGLGMKVAGAALIAIPDFAMWDIAKHIVKSAAPEWTAQRPLETDILSMGAAIPGMRYLSKGIGKMLEAKGAAEVTERALVAKPTAENYLATFRAKKAEGDFTDAVLVNYKQLTESVKPVGPVAPVELPGPNRPLLPSGTEPPANKLSFNKGLQGRQLPIPDSLKDKMLGEGFVSQDIVNTHIYDYKSMLKGFADDLISTGKSPVEALSSARQTIKRGIGLELINSASGNLVDGMAVKMRLLGPYGVDSVFREVTENGTDLVTAVNSAIKIRQHFGVDIFKQQAEGIAAVSREKEIQSSIEAFRNLQTPESVNVLAQKHGLTYDGVRDYSEFGQGKIHYFTDTKTPLPSTYSARTIEDLEKQVAESRAAFSRAQEGDKLRETVASKLEEKMKKEAEKKVTPSPSNVLTEQSIALKNEEPIKFASEAEADQWIQSRRLQKDSSLFGKTVDKETGETVIRNDSWLGRTKEKSKTDLSVSPRETATELPAKTIDQIFDTQPPDIVKKSIDKMMDTYRTNPASLGDKEFAIAHNTENVFWHTPENTQRYKKIIAGERATIFDKEVEALKATPQDVQELSKKIRDELGYQEHIKILDKAKAVLEEEGKWGKGSGRTAEDTVKAIHEVTNFKFTSFLLTGLAAGGTMVAMSSFLPSEAQAAAPDIAGRTVYKIFADALKPSSEGIMRYAKEMESAGLLSPKISTDGLKVEQFQKPIIVPADFTNISRKKRLPFGLDRILSPYTLGQLYYGGYKEGLESMSNPAVGIASAQTSAINNTMASLGVFQNIMKKFEIKSSYKEVVKEMKPIAEKYQQTISETAAHYEQERILKKSLERANKSLTKATGTEADEIKSIIDEMNGRLEIHKTAIDGNKDIIREFQGVHADKMKELAAKYPSVRISLLMEEKAGKDTLYPWLQGMSTQKELSAAASLKEMMQDYAGRMMEVGQDPITYKGYVHYAPHPDIDFNKIRKSIEQIESGASANPRLARFYERSIGGKNMMPDIFYSMERYIPDANRRIAFGDFWGQGRINGWYGHSRSTVVQANDGLRTFWDTINRNFDPFANTALSRLSDRIQMFEIARLLSFSPSVSFKHAIKLEANWSNFGWLESMKMMPETASMWARKMTPEWAKKTPALEDSVVKAFINQGAMARVVADLETINIPKNLYDRAMMKINEHGAVLIDAVENFDRAHSLVAAGMMASKKGMTASQAAYGVMDTILKTNFLSGALNPSWLRDPKVRLLFLFQGTPFKIAEQRAIQMYRTGKAVGKAGGEFLDILKSLKSDVNEGANVLKYSAIKDALLSERDIWGTPLVSQVMRKMIILGGMVTAGKMAFDSELLGHVVHAPFFEFGKKGVSFRMNPVATAAYETWQKKGEEDRGFLMDDFLKTWIKDPFVQNNVIKAMRLSKSDIPERYRDSRVRYILGVPGTGD